MAALDTYYQGESIPLTIIMTDRDGNALDLDDLDAIEINVYHENTRVVLAKYTLAVGTVIKTDAANGICDVKINGTDTEDAIVGLYIIQAKTTETDADYTPRRYRYGNAEAFILKPSV